MDERECLEIGPASQWGLPRTQVIIGWLATITATPISLFLSWNSAPLLVIAFLWLGLLVPIALGLAWLFRGATTWWISIRRRANCHEVLRNAVTVRDRRILDEQLRSQELNKVLTQLAIDPKAVRAVTYETLNSVIKNGEVLLTVPQNGRPGLVPGDRLTVLDPEDGKFMASIVVTPELSGTGHWLAAIEQFDPLYMGFVRKRAQESKSLGQRTKAYRFVVNKEGDAG